MSAAVAAPETRTEPGLDQFRRDVLAGLTARPKTLPATYFYDERGSELFEEITRLPEYYPTRTELAILEAHADEIARSVADGAALVEFGSGSTRKARILLSRMAGLSAYVPVDVSGEFLRAEAGRLAADFPGLAIEPVAADFTARFSLPARVAGRPLVGFFPGSTIGNFEPGEARKLLGRFAALLGPGATLIVGADLVKPKVVLEPAYDDAAGVTAAFNLNLLCRINRDLGADFDLSAFRHRAFFDEDLSRVEMHLVSVRPQIVTIGGRSVTFATGETIHTENSYKYTMAGFQSLAAEAGWNAGSALTDPDRLFAVFVLRAPR